MKKLLIVLAFVSVSVATMAQDEEPALKYSVATNSFWSNWYVQANFNWSAFYSTEEHQMGLSHSPFKSFRSAPNFSVAVGKWFTPSIGLRTKFYGVWGREVFSDSKDLNKYHYWDIEEQVVLNLSNLFFGYNPTRVWNLSAFGGTGFDHDMSAGMTAMVYSLGLISQWRVAKHWQINLEGGWLFKEHDADSDGYIGHLDNGGTYYNNHDQQFYLEVGLTYNIGMCTWNKVPDVDAIKALSQAQIDALNAQLADALAENARLKDLLANQKPVETEPVVIKEHTSTPVSVFFNINKTVIANESDLVDVKTVAEYAKENGSELLVTGFADSATGNEEINQKLSDGRAQTLADELVKMGVSPDNIETVGKGGVNDLSPVSYNRRATVEVK
ncbi:MAG: OmpA family protein [Prevotella sp.]|nr:OmpA family protein [Prevotella sp.]